MVRNMTWAHVNSKQLIDTKEDPRAGHLLKNQFNNSDVDNTTGRK